MTAYALQSQITFWGSQEAYLDQNFDQGDYKALSTTNEYDGVGNLAKITLADVDSGRIHATLEFK